LSQTPLYEIIKKGVPFERRPIALQVPVERPYLRLVDREPHVRFSSETSDDESAITRETIGRILVEKTAALREPEREREVPQVHDRLQTSLMKRGEHRAVMLDLGLI